MNLKNFFVAIAAASGAVPGVAILATGVGTPPESKLLFGGVTEALGAIFLLLLWVNRDKIKKMDTLRVTRVSGMFAFSFIVCLGVYILLWNVCVITIAGTSPGRPDEVVYFPIWTTGNLSKLVDNGGSRGAAVQQYGPDAVHKAIREMPRIEIALAATTMILLLVYQVSLVSLTIAFGLLGIRERAAIVPGQQPHGP